MNEMISVSCKCGEVISTEYIERTINPKYFFYNLRKEIRDPKSENTQEPEQFIKLDKPYYKQTQCEKCQKKEKTNKLLAMTKIPKDTHHSRFDNYKLHKDKKTSQSQKKKIEAFQIFIDSNWTDEMPKPKIITMHGTCGTGKGHLVASLFWELLYKDPFTKCRFVDYNDTLRRIKDTYVKESIETESDVINKLRDHDVLCIDELGITTKESEWAYEKIHAIISGRFNTEIKTTIITTNLSKDELRDYLSDHHKRLLSRIFAKGNWSLLFNWSDYRMKREDYED